MISKYRRWRRLAAYRPRMVITPVTLAYAIIACLVVLCAILAIHTAIAHYDAKLHISRFNAKVSGAGTASAGLPG